MSAAHRNIRWAKVVGPSNDKGPYKLVDLEADGKQITAMVLDLGGVHVTPVKDGQALILLPDGDEGKAVCIVMPPPAKRVDEQKEGMMTLKNHVKGQSIVLDDNGNIIAKTTGTYHINPPDEA